MEQMTSDMAQFIAYLVGIFLSIFGLGFYFRSYIKGTIDETCKGCPGLKASEEMSNIRLRVEVLERNAVSHETHEKDINRLFSLIESVREDIKEGMSGLTARVDNLIPLLLKNNKP